MALIMCALVLPVSNRALVLQENGKHYWVTYKDRGDYIEYSPSVVPPLVIELTEHRRGTVPRVGCDTIHLGVRSHIGVPQP